MKKINSLKFILFGILFLFLSPALGFSELGNLLQKFGVSKSTTLNDTKIGAGLKEALKVGVDKTVQLTGKKDGYLSNEAIKILMPDKVKKAEALLRKAGLGPKLDEFVVSMNRAAEKAAPQAKNVFIDAIGNMSFEDVQKIYKGGDTAATNYFKDKTSVTLANLYKPIVVKAMTDYNVTNQYQNISASYNKLPFAANFKLPAIEDYVVQKSLSGLFHVLGEQEKNIRNDPAAQVTNLLKEVFKK